MKAYRILPKAISSKSKIGFFTPSDPILTRRVQYIKEGLQILKDWGFSIDPIDEAKLDYWSKPQSPIAKVKEFHRLLNDSTIDILMATWGGKNSNDILPLIDYDLVAHSRKVIIGHSDIAVILNAIVEKSNLITFYGPNILGKLNQTKEFGLPLQRSMAFSNYTLFNFEEMEYHKVVQSGKCNGQLFGGSLGTFTLGLSGTEYMPNYSKIIFFFESSSLNIFRIRQHFQHLKLTGFIDRVVGVITGATDQITKEQSNEFDQLLIEFFPKCPIIRSNAFGHGYYRNYSIPVGATVILDLDIQKKCILQ